jgi:hypothetical protein
MLKITGAIVLVALGADPIPVEPAHRQNPVYVQVLNQGLELEGRTAKLPAPRLVDGQDGGAQRAALRDVAGSDRALDDLLRNSVTAPYIIKVRDEKTPRATIRIADLWFAVYAAISQVDPAKEAARSDGKEVEAGNMWFQSRILKASDLSATGIEPAADVSSGHTWYTHIHGRLLDRIDFGVTNQVVASQSHESTVIAARTDRAFAKDESNANYWIPLASPRTAKADSPNRPYAGGISYTKISRLAFKPEALLVEIHTAFVEPNEWFRGAPILRSKLSVIAQDQIRRLRRELSRQQADKVKR